MVRKLKKDSNGRFRYAANPPKGTDGPRKGAFATRSDRIAYTKVQRTNSYYQAIPKNRKLQNSVRTVALNLGVSEREAQRLMANFLADKEAAEERGEEIPFAPGSG